MTGTGRGTGATPQQGAFQVVSLAARPELTLPALELLAAGWPEFMRHDPTAERHQARLATELAGFQALLVDREKDELAALGVSIPFAWDGTLAGLPAGWDAVVEQGVGDLDEGRRPTALSALSVTVAPDRRGQGLSRLVVRGLKAAATRAGLGALLAPVRPSGKSAYPLTPMERYVRWARPDGAPFDPGCAPTGGSGARCSGSAQPPWRSPPRWPPGRPGRGWRSLRPARTWSRARSCRWPSTANATSAAIWSQMSGSGTGARAICRRNRL